MQVRSKFAHNDKDKLPNERIRLYSFSEDLLQKRSPYSAYDNCADILHEEENKIFWMISHAS